jgi:hypothetical protein
MERASLARKHQWDGEVRLSMEVEDLSHRALNMIIKLQEARKNSSSGIPILKRRSQPNRAHHNRF